MTTANIFAFSDTWNNVSTTFNGIKLDVTDSASASDSALVDLQVGSVSQFKVDKGGIITANGFLAEGNVDLQGNRIVLDADNDSYINVNGDDSVSIYISGTEVLKFDGAADDKLILDGVSFAPTGAVVGQALGFPNSASTLEPYTPAGGGDLLAAADEVVTGAYRFDNAFGLVVGDNTVNLELIARSGVGYAIVGTDTNHDLYFRRNNVEAFRIENTRDVRFAGGAVTGTLDGSAINVTSTSGSEARSLADRYDDVINVKDFGAVGDGVTDDSTAIQSALDAGNDVFFPDGDYLVGTKLTKSGSFWRILGAGNDRTVLIGDNGNNPILECDTVGTLITNIEVGHMQFRGNSDRTSGALLEFKKKLLNSSLPELGLRRYYDGIKFTGGAKIRITGLLCDQQGRGSGTKGRYTLHLSGDATNEKVSDFHLTNANLSGLVDGADGLVAHLGVEACDGIYLNNSHFFYSDQAVLFTPTNATAGFDDICASFFASNCYFDSSVTGEHIKWTGDATSYRNFRFSNCEFRDSGSTDGSCVIDANVDRVRFNSTCSWRSNDRSGIMTTAGHTVSGLFVGGEFQGNNTDANANAEDIRVLATGASISADFVDGGSAAANINLLSGTTSAKIVDCDFTRSNATTKVTDSGTDTLIKTNTGHSALCAFSATTASSNLSLTASAQQVLYSGEEYDLGGDFDPAAGEFTAPVDGLYEFKLSCQFINLTRAYVNTSDAGSATDPVIEQDRIDVQIRKDTGTGNAILRRRIVKTTSNEEGVTMFMQVQLDAGDIVNVAVVNINGARGELRLTGTGFHEFSGRLIERIY